MIVTVETRRKDMYEKIRCCISDCNTELVRTAEAYPSRLVPALLKVCRWEA
jgi:hypothetical protein